MVTDEMQVMADEALGNLPEEHRRRGAAAGIGATIGGVAGSIFGGPVGAAIGASVGAAVGVAVSERSNRGAGGPVQDLAELE